MGRRSERDNLDPESSRPDRAEGGGAGPGEVDVEAVTFWDEVCASVPTLDPESIATIALVVRSIDRRRASG